MEDLFEVRFDPMTSLANAVGTLHGRGNVPFYQALQGALRKATEPRILRLDDGVPSERDLAVKFAVSRPRPAMQAL